MASSSNSNVTKIERYQETSYQIMNVPATTENESQVAQNQQEAHNKTKTKKIIVAIILVAFIAFIIADSLTNGYVKQGIDIFLEWIEENPIPGVFAFVGVYFVATGSILTLGSGFIFANVFGLGIGVLLATVAVFIGASAGAIVAFLLGRYLLRDWVKIMTTKYPLFEAIDVALETKGFRIMALLRLSPIIPFNALNYISGITAISFVSYTWAMFAILPGTVLYVFLGATAGSLSDSSQSSDNNTVKIISVVVGIVFGVLGIVAVSYYAKQELNNVIQRHNEENNQNQAEGNIEAGKECKRSVHINSDNNN